MRVVMVVIVVHPAPAAAHHRRAGHGHAALLADLRALCFHAGGDFRPVRDEVGTKPHRIGRTSLLNVDGAVRAAPWAPACVKAKKSNAQTGNASRQTKDVVRICLVPGLRDKLSIRSAAKLADTARVDGPGEELHDNRPACGDERVQWTRPGKTAARVRAVSGDVAWCSARCRPRSILRRHVVKRHVPAKYPVRHGDDDIARAAWSRARPRPTATADRSRHGRRSARPRQKARETARKR